MGTITQVQMADVAAAAANGVGQWVRPGSHVSAQFYVNFKKNELVVGDLLDVYIEVSYDGGLTVGDIIHWLQQTGTTALSRRVLGIAPFGATDSSIATNALAAGAEIVHLAPMYRARWVVAGVSPDFDFEVWGSFFE